MSDEAKKTESTALSGPSFEDYKAVATELAETRVELKTTAAELDTVKTELDEAKASQESLKSALAKGGLVLEDSLPGISEKLTKADVSQLFDVIAENVKADSVASSDKVKAAEEAKAAAEAELVALQTKVRAGERLSKIQSELSLGSAEGDDAETVEAKVAQATKIADSTKELDDEAFASHIEDLKSLLVIAKKGFVPFGKDKKDGEKDDKKKDKMDTKAGDGITDPSILDNVVATASVDAGTDNSGNDNAVNLQTAYAGLIGDLISSREETENTDN